MKKNEEKQIKMTLGEAQEIYPDAPEAFKRMLEINFGKSSLILDVRERIKTYEDACRELNIIPVSEEEFKALGLEKDEIAYRKIKIIVKALNEGWVGDVYNNKEYRYYPYFYPCSPSGFAFDYSYFDLDYAVAGSGSRLCFKTRDLSDYAGKQFADLYKEFIK